MNPKEVLIVAVVVGVWYVTMDRCFNNSSIFRRRK